MACYEASLNRLVHFLRTNQWVRQIFLFHVMSAISICMSNTKIIQKVYSSSTWGSKTPLLKSCTACLKFCWDLWFWDLKVAVKFHIAFVLSYFFVLLCFCALNISFFYIGTLSRDVTVSHEYTCSLILFLRPLYKLQSPAH